MAATAAEVGVRGDGVKPYKEYKRENQTKNVLPWRPGRPAAAVAFAVAAATQAAAVGGAAVAGALLYRELWEC